MVLLLFVGLAEVAWKAESLQIIKIIAASRREGNYVIYLHGFKCEVLLAHAACWVVPQKHISFFFA